MTPIRWPYLRSAHPRGSVAQPRKKQMGVRRVLNCRRSWAPDSTPTFHLTPALCPASKSSVVSPTLATRCTLLAPQPPSRGRSKTAQDDPAPRRRHTRLVKELAAHPSASSSIPVVSRSKPVFNATRTPRSRSSMKVVSRRLPGAPHPPDIAPPGVRGTRRRQIRRGPFAAGPPE